MEPQNSVLAELRKKSIEVKKTIERDTRKNAAKEKKKLQEDSVITKFLEKF
jgi:hypothetical protein